MAMKSLVEAARAAGLVTHSAAGLANAVKAKEAARLLRAAEGLCRAAVAALLAEPAVAPTEEQGDKKKKKKRRRRNRKKQVAVEEVDQADASRSPAVSASASAMATPLPAASSAGPVDAYMEGSELIELCSHDGQPAAGPASAKTPEDVRLLCQAKGPEAIALFEQYERLISPGAGKKSKSSGGSRKKHS